MLSSNVIQLRTQQTAVAQNAKIKTILPGVATEIAQNLFISIAYDSNDGEYEPRFIFWYCGQRIQDAQLNQNNMIDLRKAVGIIISLKEHLTKKNTRRILSTTIIIEKAPYCLERRNASP